MQTEQKLESPDFSQDLIPTPEFDDKLLGKSEVYKVPTFQTEEVNTVDFQKITKEPQESQTILEQDGFSTTFILPYTAAADLNNYLTSIFTAYFPCELRAASLVYGTAASGSNVGFHLKRRRGATANTITTSIFRLDSTADTVQTKYAEANFDPSYRFLLKDDRIYIEQFGTLTSTRDVCVTLHFRYSGRGESRLN